MNLKVEEMQILLGRRKIGLARGRQNYGEMAKSHKLPTLTSLAKKILETLNCAKEKSDLNVDNLEEQFWWNDLHFGSKLI